MGYKRRWNVISFYVLIFDHFPRLIFECLYPMILLNALAGFAARKDYIEGSLNAFACRLFTLVRSLTLVCPPTDRQSKQLRSKHPVSFLPCLVIPLAMGLSACQRTSPADPEIDTKPIPLFKLRKSTHTGVTFSNEIKEGPNRNIIRYQGYYDGGGVVTADFNNDGLIDIFFTANLSPNRLYLNRGDFRFEDITQPAGLGRQGFGWYTGATVVDINSDGWLDLYLCKSGLFKPENRKNQLYVNNGDLTFTEAAADYGLDHAGFSTHAAFFDYDRDGDLDMYLANYGANDLTESNEKVMRLRKGSDPYSGDKLFENVNRKYVDVTPQANIIDHKYGYAHSIGIGDLNADGWEDIFVCNDFSEPDYLYLNQGDKTFRESSQNAFRHLSNYSMGSDVSDFNNDGWLDITVLDMVAEDHRRQKENMGGMQREAFEQFVQMGFHYQYMSNMLHVNNGNSTFSEMAHLAGISNTDWSWAPLMADFDNDGWKDLYITNGLKRDARNEDARLLFVEIVNRAEAEGRKSLTDQEWARALNAMPSEKLVNYMYKNNHDLTFKKVSEGWGLGYASFSNGAAYSDLDNDGDLDLVVNNINEPAYIFENRGKQENPGNYLKIKFLGPDDNRYGLGAKAWLYQGEDQQFQQHYFTRGFRSAMAGPMHFGLGSANVADSLKVVWPDGKVNLLYNMRAGQTLEVRHHDGEEPKATSQPEDKGYFSTVFQALNLHHLAVENDYDDYQREELLPHKMSTLGPFISVGDVNRDGLEDFFIGGAKGHPGSTYVQQSDGTFLKKRQKVLEDDSGFEDMGSAFFDFDGDDDLDLYVVSGGNELPVGSAGYQDRLYVNDGKGNFSGVRGLLPELTESGSVVVAEDFDQDGDPDLFVGGRQVPGRYPYPVTSYLLENVGGKFKNITLDNAPEFKDLGMVTSALWMDYDNDDDQDLIIAGEWMPLKVFENREGKFSDRTGQCGLSKSNGWWFSLAAFDFDHDGDKDLVAGNVGLNYKYKASEDEPFQVFSTDFDANGSNDIVLAWFNQGEVYPLRGRSCSALQIPGLEEKFPTYKSFASASLQEVYGVNELGGALHYQAYTFASSYFQNNGNSTFTAKTLPNLAQISSSNGIQVLDADSDGWEDLVVAGNLYSSEAETVRNDAGYGMFLKSDGQGNFQAVSYINSGLFIEGDVKDLKLIKTAKGPVLLAAKNNDYLQAVKLLDH